jgi:hypothetical protein
MVYKLKADGKPMQLLQLMDPEPRHFIRRFLFPDPTDGKRPFKDLTTAERYKDLIRLQAKANYVWSKLRPQRERPDIKSWLETLTLGYVGGEDPDKPAKSSVVAAVVPIPYQYECRQLLDALWDSQLVEWKADGTLYDPERRTILKGSNIYNICQQLYTPDSPATQNYISRYEPTALSWFVDRIMKLAQENDNLPVRVVEEIKNARLGSRRYTVRTCYGRGYNLVSMFYTFAKFIPRFLSLFPSLQLFLPVFLILNPVSWSSFVYLYNWLTVVKRGDRITAHVLDKTQPVVQAISSLISNETAHEFETGLQEATLAYGHLIPQYVFLSALHLAGSIATGIFNTFRRMIPGIGDGN